MQKNIVSPNGTQECNRILVHSEHLNMQVQQDGPSRAQENLFETYDEAKSQS